MFKKIARYFVIASMCLTCSTAFGQGHYGGASFNPGDYFVPPASGFILPVYYSYMKQNFYNSAGKKSDVLINPRPDDPTSLNIGQSVSTNSAIIMAMYAGRQKILNASWGMMLIPILSSPTANIALDYYSTQTGSGVKRFQSNSFGFSDLYFQPIWLSWEEKKWTYSFTYGVFLPIGKYKAGDMKNVGLGYFSQDIRVATRFKPTGQWTVSLAATIELNSKQRGVDFREAPHFTADYGGSYTFLKGHEIGAYGYYTTQMGHDKGTEGLRLSDRIFGIGAYGSYWFIPGKFGILGRVVQNLGARNRFGGFTATVGLNLLLLDKPKTVAAQ